MTAALAKKVAFRAEHTGNAGQDRAQRQAQTVAVAHEQTKAIVSALMNQSYVALAVDTGPVATAAFAQLMSTTITTVLDSGHLVLNFSASAEKGGASGHVFFELLVDGVVTKGAGQHVVLAGVTFVNVSMVVRVAVRKGTHVVAVNWRTDVNNIQISAATGADSHAHLLVQEAL